MVVMVSPVVYEAIRDHAVWEKIRKRIRAEEGKPDPKPND